MDEPHRSGLARSGVPGEEGELTLVHTQRDIAQSVTSMRILFRDTSEFDHRIGWRKGLTILRRQSLDISGWGVKAILCKAMSKCEGFDH